MTIRGVLFDLDGTLLDHDAAVVEALHTWLPALGVTVTPAVMNLWHGLTERHLVDWRRGLIDFAEQRRRRIGDFLPALGVPVGDDDTSRDVAFDGYFQEYRRCWRPFDDVEDALVSVGAAGLRTAVLTNGALEQQREKLAAIGLLPTIGPVYAADELGVAKPASEAYRLACERWGLSPGEVMHVGDRYDLDVVAARAAGLHAVHLDRHDSGREAERMTTLRELVSRVRRPPGA